MKIFRPKSDVWKAARSRNMIGNTRGRGNRREKINKICSYCHKEFWVHPYREKIAIACSRKCARLMQVYTPERKEKMRRAMRGRNTKFGDGIPTTSQRKLIRELPEYKMWRTHCFQRDEYICQDCGQIGGKLHVDHIIPFSAILQMYNIRTVEDAVACDFLWDIRNGRTLCVPCHRKTPTYAGKGMKRVKA